MEREFLLSNQWGSFFTDELHVPINSTHTEEDSVDSTSSVTKPCCNPSSVDSANPTVLNTFWTGLMKKHATIAVPRIDYMSGMLQYRIIIKTTTLIVSCVVLKSTPETLL